MQPQLFPIEFAEDSVERHLADHSEGGRGIYVSIIVVLLAAIAALPVIRTTVSVQSSGIIRPLNEKHEVRARTSGLVERLLVRENRLVRHGDSILVLQRGEFEHEAALIETKTDVARRSVHDLEVLAASRASHDMDGGEFRSSKYRQEYAKHVDALRAHRLKQVRAERELQRAEALYATNMTAFTELEDRQFQLSQLEADASQIQERSLATWQADLAAARIALAELGSQREHLEESNRLYTVTAPVTGTVEQLARVSAGSFVQAGDLMAMISPNSELVAEVYVTSRDIGLVRVGTPVRMQIDAFHYNDWGFVAGRVTEVPDDFVLIDQRPVFKVRCALDQTHLALRSGVRRQLKKGMTLRARFLVAERSLFQLLRDDINDWLNPTQAGASRQPA